MVGVERVVVAVGNLEDRESPDAPSAVAFVDGSGERVVLECSCAEADNDEQARRLGFSEGEWLKHAWTLRLGWLAAGGRVLSIGARM